MFVIAHFLFAYLTQRALKAYTMIGDEGLNALNASNDNFIDLPTRYINKVPLKFWQWRWVVFQVLATLVLVAILFIRLLK